MVFSSPTLSTLLFFLPHDSKLSRPYVQTAYKHQGEDIVAKKSGEDYKKIAR